MQKKQNKTALVWFRNDLRVHDNVVLQAAIENSQNVIALYCFDPRQFQILTSDLKKQKNSEQNS